MPNLKDKLAQKIEIVQEDISVRNENINNNDNKIVVLKPNEFSITDEVVPEFAITINAAKERINMLQSFVKDMMIPNVDYGIIQGCKKPSLLKPGAEKLCDIFGFSKQLEVLNRIEDWNSGLFHYEIKVVLTNKKTGLVEAEGIGCCNSKEKKFKNQDSFTIINTLLKMAKKRAMIDAVLSATRSSGIFTQDMEDMEPDKPSDKFNANNNHQINNTRYNRSNTVPKVEYLTKEQQWEIFKAIEQGQIPLTYAKSMMKEKYNVDQTKQLTTEQADEFIDVLKCCSVI
ncbi:MAG: hypothetical protein AB7V16_11285 [Vulcanibacillus sp.]